MSMSRDSRVAWIGAVVASVAVSSAELRAEGFKLWRPFAKTSTVTYAEDGLGGMPYAESSQAAPASSSWKPGSAMSSAWSSTSAASKKAWNTTVDVVTLKPLRTSKPEPSQFRLGAHPDPRSQPKKTSGGLLGSLFGKSEEPRRAATVEEFFSQERP